MMLCHFEKLLQKCWFYKHNIRYRNPSKNGIHNYNSANIICPNAKCRSLFEAIILYTRIDPKNSEDIVSSIIQNEIVCLWTLWHTYLIFGKYGCVVTSMLYFLYWWTITLNVCCQGWQTNLAQVGRTDTWTQYFRCY